MKNNFFFTILLILMPFFSFSQSDGMYHIDIIDSKKDPSKIEVVFESETGCIRILAVDKEDFVKNTKTIKTIEGWLAHIRKYECSK